MTHFAATHNSLRICAHIHRTVIKYILLAEVAISIAAINACEWGIVWMDAYFMIVCCVSSLLRPKTFCFEKHSSIMRWFLPPTLSLSLFLLAYFAMAHWHINRMLSTIGIRIVGAHKMGKIRCRFPSRHWCAGSSIVDGFYRPPESWPIEMVRTSCHRSSSHCAHRNIYNIHNSTCCVNCQVSTGSLNRDHRHRWYN